jgi:hypothetical protein
MGLGFIGDIRHICALIINSLLLSKGETENLEEDAVNQLLKEAKWSCRGVQNLNLNSHSSTNIYIIVLLGFQTQRV